MQTRQIITTPHEAKQLETSYRIQKRSVDARQKNLKILLTLLTDDNGQYVSRDTPLPLYEKPIWQNCTDKSPKCHIVGAGPAGLFAALTLLQHGIKPIVYERGKDQQAERGHCTV